MTQRDNRSNWVTDTLGNRPFIVGAPYLSSFFLPLLLLIGVPRAFIFRREPSEEWELSHYRYLARTFWLALVLLIVVAALAVGSLLVFGETGKVAIPVLIVCLPLAAIIVGQFGVRSVMSMARAVAREPMPNPNTFLF